MANFLHTMVRVTDPEQSRALLRGARLPLLAGHGHRPQRRARGDELLLLARRRRETVLELTHNHDDRTYEPGTGYGHIAIGVDDLDGTLAVLKDGHGRSSPNAPPYQVSEGARGAQALR